VEDAVVKMDVDKLNEVVVVNNLVLDELEEVGNPETKVTVLTSEDLELGPL
jgi:hypothetical protein